MGLTKRFILDNAVINCVALASTYMMQLKNQTIDMGVDIVEEIDTGSIDRTFVSARGIMPKIPLNTTDLGFLANCGMNGLYIAPDSDSPGFYAYGREVPVGQFQAARAGTVHMRFAVSNGLLVPMSIRAGHNTIAEFAMLLHAILGDDDDSNDAPLVVDSGVAIVNSGLADPAYFAAGPVQYDAGDGDVVLLGITDVSITFGIDVKVEGSDSDVYPSHVGKYGRMLAFEFATLDTTFAAVVQDGIELDSFTQFFRKYENLTTRVPIDTSEHIAVSTDQGKLTPGATGLAQRTPGSSAYTFRPISVDGDPQATIDVTSQIPA